MSPTASSRRWALLSGLALAACGGGGGGGGGEDPPLGPNAAPQITVPGTLSGAAPSFVAVVPAGVGQQLVFTASDPDGDPLAWQVSVGGGTTAAIGASYPVPAAGPTFTLTLAAVSLPASAKLTVLVEDPRGGAAAIDVLLVRSGAPVVESAEPGGAFTTLRQRVTLRGHGFRLGGIVTPIVAFQGLEASDVVVTSDEELACTTPTLVAGPVGVTVTHAFGAGALAAGAFTARAFPPPFAANDQRVGPPEPMLAFDLALAGSTAHAAVVHPGATPGLAYQRSTDGGTSWSQPLPIAAGDLLSPRLCANGAAVDVLWLGNGSAPAGPDEVWFARSADGGVAFEPPQPLDGPPAAGATVALPWLAADGELRCAAWREGSAALGTDRIRTTVSANAGTGWNTPLPADDALANQTEPTLGLDGNDAWLVFLDERLGPAARGVYALHSADGGATWGNARRLSPGTTIASAPRAAAAGGSVHAAWLQEGVLRTTSSADRGRNWSSSSVIVDDGSAGVIADHSIACDGQRVWFAYTVGGSAVQLARMVQAGAPVQRTQVDTSATPSAQTAVHVEGNYVYVVWREGDPTTGAARVRLAISGDGGATFAWSGGLGDGTATQRDPRLVHAGARLFLGWDDRRDAAPALYTNRTVQ